MKKYLLVFLIITPLLCSSQSWIQKASIFNYGRYSAIGCAAQGKGYVGMGQIENGKYLNDFWEYDPVTNKWIRKADFPSDGRYGASAHTIKGKIYVCFGYDNSKNSRNDLWEYNPTTNSWTKKADFPGLPRYSASGFVIGDSLLYIGTGTYNNSSDYLYDFWMYNPTNNTWTKKADFGGNKRQDAASFTINDYGYIGSGLSDYMTPTKDFWKYDPVNDSWTEIQSLPTEEATLVSFTINNKAYVGGGIATFPYTDTNNFLEFDSNTNTWKEMKPQDEAFPRLAGVGFSIGEVGYFGTGFNDINLYFSDFWAFDINATNEDDDEQDDDEEEDEDDDDDDDEPCICKCDSTYELKLYPNPAVNKVVLEIGEGFKLEKMTVYIYTSLGQLVITETSSTNRKEIEISHLESGLYLTKVYLDDLLIVKRFIKL